MAAESEAVGGVQRLGQGINNLLGGDEVFEVAIP